LIAQSKGLEKRESDTTMVSKTTWVDKLKRNIAGWALMFLKPRIASIKHVLRREIRI
jgi:hypothetical protein